MKGYLSIMYLSIMPFISYLVTQSVFTYYLIYDHTTSLYCDSATNISEGDISAIRVPGLPRPLLQ